MEKFDAIIRKDVSSPRGCRVALLVRARYLVDARSVTQVRGLPFRTDELVSAIEEQSRD